MPLPSLPQPMASPGCPKQRRAGPGHFSIQGERMCRLYFAAATDTAWDVCEKAEMTGTTIRQPYLEKSVQTFRRGALLWHGGGVDAKDGEIWSRC